MKKNILYGVVTVYTDTRVERRVSVFLKEDSSFDHIEYRGEIYESADEFRKDYDYAVMVVSDEAIRTALSDAGFTVKDSERINTPLHIALPGWQINALDRLREDEYINFSRSDLINKIILDNLNAVPPEYDYEKKMTKTMLTVNPVVLSRIEEMAAGGSRSRNHLIYDYVTHFLERKSLQ